MLIHHILIYNFLCFPEKISTNTLRQVFQDFVSYTSCRVFRKNHHKNMALTPKYLLGSSCTLYHAFREIYHKTNEYTPQWLLIKSMHTRPRVSYYRKSQINNPYRFPNQNSVLQQSQLDTKHFSFRIHSRTILKHFKANTYRHMHFKKTEASQPSPAVHQPTTHFSDTHQYTPCRVFLFCQPIYPNYFMHPAAYYPHINHHSTFVSAFLDTPARQSTAVKFSIREIAKSHRSVNGHQRISSITQYNPSPSTPTKQQLF